MSLYYDAASLLSPASPKEGSLKSRVFKTDSNLKSNPSTIYALLSETAKYDSLLKEVIERAGILALEPKLTPILSLLLVHDHLFSKKGIAATTSHPLRLAIERHKARLHAELTKCRTRRGFASVDDLKKHVAGQAKRGGAGGLHPRWVRVNRIKSTVSQQILSAFSGYTQNPILADVLDASTEEKVLYKDNHVPDLLALPPRIELTKTQAYKKGELVLQDKASCFPAYLLLGSSNEYEGGDILDACAAPGNKTTHLASILSQQSTAADSVKPNSKPVIFACERDPFRSLILEKMAALSGAGDVITVLAKQDFLALDPSNARFANVTHLLLDPSCSGSGIIGRDDMPVLQLPKDPRSKRADPTASEKIPVSHSSTKRKRDSRSQGHGKNGHDRANPSQQSNGLEYEESRCEVDLARLDGLATLQTKIIAQAFSFPAARRITYSTCSIHVQENEAVVARALHAEVARQRGWRVMKREEQPDGMQRWMHRGLASGEQGGRDGDDSQSSRNTALHGLSEQETEACIRCQAGDYEGTMGFFVCGFLRDSMGTEVNGAREPYAGQRKSDEEYEEWEGFSDADDDDDEMGSAR